MARSRLPNNVAKFTGAVDRNPARFKGRSSPRVDAIGDPYKTMPRAEKAAWRRFAKELPWLASSDRMLLRVTCHLSVKFETSPSLTLAAELRRCLASLGGNPCDRSKVTPLEAEEGGEVAQKYFSKRS